MPMKDWAKLPAATEQNSVFALSKMCLTIRVEQVQLEFFAFCGRRPEALPLDTAIFCKKLSKTFIQPERTEHNG